MVLFSVHGSWLTCPGLPALAHLPQRPALGCSSRHEGLTLYPMMLLLWTLASSPSPGKDRSQHFGGMGWIGLWAYLWSGWTYLADFTNRTWYIWFFFGFLRLGSSPIVPMPLPFPFSSFLANDHNDEHGGAKTVELTWEIGMGFLVKDTWFFLLRS